MPIYRLKPIPALVEDPEWRTSSFRGVAWANTATEEEARRLLSGRFDTPAISTGPDRPASPWLQARLVEAEIVEPPPGVDIPEGTMVAERVP